MINTLEKHMKDWIHNILQGHSLDVSKIPGCFKMPVVVAGAGASLEAGIEQLKKTYIAIIANQSSLLRLVHEGIHPWICLITDSNPITIERIKQARRMGWSGYVVASTACPKELDYDTQNPVYWFKHCLHGKEYHCFNTVLAETDPKILTCVLQVGCVANASILLADYLMKEGVLTNGAIHLTGVDYSYGVGSSRCLQVTKEGELKKALIEEEQGPIIRVGGFLTSEVMLEYRHQFAIVVDNLEREIVLMNDGFLNDFVETKAL